jgi:hypothetical protein
LFRNPASQQGQGCAQTALSFGWQTPSPPISLTSYAGQTITLDFAVYNRVNGFNNTYLYLDNIVVTP